MGSAFANRAVVVAALLLFSGTFPHGQSTIATVRPDALLKDLPRTIPELAAPQVQSSVDSVAALYPSLDSGFITAASSLSVRVYPYASLADAEQGFGRTLNMPSAPYNRTEMRHGLTLYRWDSAGPTRVMFRSGTSVVEITAPTSFAVALVTSVSDALIDQMGGGPSSTRPGASAQADEPMQTLLESWPKPDVASVTSIQEGRAEILVELTSPGRPCVSGPLNARSLSRMKVRVALLGSDGRTAPQTAAPTVVATSRQGCTVEKMQFHFETTRPTAPGRVALTVNGVSREQEISSPVAAILAAIRAGEVRNQPRRTFVLGDRLSAAIRKDLLATGDVIEAKNLPDSTRGYTRIDVFDVGWNYATIKLAEQLPPWRPGDLPPGCGETATFTVVEAGGRWAIGDGVTVVC